MASDIEHQSPTQYMNDPNTHCPNPDHENPASRSCLASFIIRVIFQASRLLHLAFIVAYIVLISVSYLLFPLVAMIMLSSYKRSNLDKTGSSSEGMAGIYQQSKRTDTPLSIRIRMSSLGLFARAGLLVLVWLALNFWIPRFKMLTLLGSPLWRWSLLAVTITVGYFAALGVYMAFPMLQYFRNLFIPPQQRKFSLGYLFFPMLFTSSFVMYIGIVLVSWLLYFRTEHGLKNASTPHPQAFEYVTWTCVSLFVGSVFWLLKTIVLLNWSANTIYRRFQPRILITEVKFFYVGVIIGGFLQSEDIRELVKVVEEIVGQWEPTNFNVSNHILSRKSNLTHIEQVGRYLKSLARHVRQLKEDGVPDLVELFQQNITMTDEKCELDNLLELLSCNDNPSLFPSEEQQKKTAIVLHGLVREHCSSDEFSYDDLKKWMVDAHKNCVNMGRTLADANAIVTHLDLFISFIIFLAVVLFWLLITGVATTTVLVAITPPFLALTFIFGDSAKTFFQGILFCFATHPFDVGDRCILDETEMEVKSIGILTTTFIKIGTMEKRLYPNSLLATKPIVNLGWHPDPSDVVELTLDLSTTPTDLQMLEAKVLEFFSDPQQKGYFEKSHEVMMKDIGDKIKVAIHFTHVLNIKEVTHSQCLQKKNKQRSIFLKKINHFLAPKSPVGSANDDVDGGGNSQVSPGSVPISPLRRARTCS